MSQRFDGIPPNQQANNDVKWTGFPLKRHLFAPGYAGCTARHYPALRAVVMHLQRQHATERHP